MPVRTVFLLMVDIKYGLHTKVASFGPVHSPFGRYLARIPDRDYPPFAARDGPKSASLKRRRSPSSLPGNLAAGRKKTFVDF